MEMSLVWFILLAALGIAYCVLSFVEYLHIDDKDFKPFFKHKLLAIIIFTVGILVHTMGGVLNGGTPYGDSLEMQFQTAGHFIIMLGAIIIIVQARHLAKMTGRQDV